MTREELLSQGLRAIEHWAVASVDGAGLARAAIASEAARTGLTEKLVREIWARGFDVDTVLEEARRAGRLH